jgi:CheY-like chemotaxis protein
MDGVEATRRIRRLPGGNQVKIIAVTASAFAQQRRELREAGMDDFVAKPYRVEELYDRMATHLGLRYRLSDDDASRPAVPLTPALLATVEPELRERLRLALESLDSTAIAGVIGQIGAADAELAAMLSRLTDQFDYPAILAALGAVARHDA